MSLITDRIKYKGEIIALSEVEHIRCTTYRGGVYHHVHFYSRSGHKFYIRVETEEEKDYLLKQIEYIIHSIHYRGHFQLKIIPEYVKPEPEIPEPEEQVQPEPEEQVQPEQTEKKKSLIGKMFN